MQIHNSNKFSDAIYKDDDGNIIGFLIDDDSDQAKKIRDGWEFTADMDAETVTISETPPKAVQYEIERSSLFTVALQIYHGMLDQALAAGTADMSTKAMILLYAHNVDGSGRATRDDMRIDDLMTVMNS